MAFVNTIFCFNRLILLRSDICFRVAILAQIFHSFVYERRRPFTTYIYATRTTIASDNDAKKVH